MSALKKKYTETKISTQKRKKKETDRQNAQICREIEIFSDKLTDS